MIFCNKLIKKGMLLRYITTIITFYVLYIYINNKLIKKYFYLILPILLIALDKVDNIIFKSFNECKLYTKSFYYQCNDKICDSISYLLLYLFFKFDNFLLFFILYRMIGVILFYYTKNSKWLILFFDFVKEYILYLFVFGKNYTFMPLFIFLKICFEYYFHTIFNHSDYNNELKMNIK